jgi:hypothetical protein
MSATSRTAELPVRLAQLSLVEEVQRAAGFPIAEAEALVEPARGGVVLISAEVHLGCTLAPGEIDRSVHQRPTNSLAATIGNDVERLEIAVERGLQQ